MSKTPGALPDLLLLPGTMCDERLWSDVAPLLHSHARLHYGDLAKDVSLAAMAERALGAMPGRFHLCGFSMGGYVAREIVSMAPERVISLVLINTSSAGITAADMAKRDGMAKLLEGRPFNGLTRSNLEKAVHPARAGDADLLGRIQQMAKDLGGEVFARQLRLARADGKEGLGRIACPTLVVAARDDRLRSLDESRTLAEGIPDARIEIIENCGHMTPLERPDALAEILTDWLAR